MSKLCIVLPALSENTAVFCQGRITELQRLQMTVPASQANNVEAWGVDGSSDDLDIPLASRSLFGAAGRGGGGGGGGGGGERERKRGEREREH